VEAIHKLARYSVAFVCLVSLLYIGNKTFFDPSDTIDFKFLWLAGDLWQQGENPYSAVFHQKGQELFQGTNVPEWFFYPPFWYPISYSLAFFEYESLALAWRSITTAFVISGTYIAFSAARDEVKTLNTNRLWFGVIFVCVSTATAITLTLGQTSGIAYFAMCLFLRAWLKNERGLMIIALALLMLKPNLGVVFGFFLVTQKYWWPSIVAAALICLVAAAPAMLPYGPIDVTREYLGSLGHWGTQSVGQPAATTGLRNIIYMLSGFQISASIFTLCAGVLAIGLGLISASQNRDGQPVKRSAEMSVLIGIVGVMVPLHTYDLIFPALLIFVMVPRGRVLAALTACSLVVLLRPNNIAQAIGVVHPQAGFSAGSFLASLALLLLLLIALHSLFFAE
jgi:hypothetical protein